jgi:hypothetical protein
MDSMIINHWAVLVAAISDLFVGALWYSPLLFYKGWMKANNFEEGDLKKGQEAKTFGLATLFAIIISYNLAFFLAEPSTTAMWGLQAGLLAGIWAFLAFWIIALFEQRKTSYVFINGGYILVAFALKGFIIGAWR